jgi:hypothetical protein
MFTTHGKLFMGDYKSIAYSVVFIIILMFSEAVQEYNLFNNFSFYYNNNKLIRQITYCSLIIAIIMFGVFDGSQFIYFQF